MKALLCATPLFLISFFSSAQSVYQIKADSVRIYNTCDTAELILENRTQKIPGFLFNKGNGRTEFQQLKLIATGNNAIAIQGQDTLNLDTAISSWGDARYDLASTNFITIPQGDSLLWEAWSINKAIAYDAYLSPDMPALSEQAFQGKGGNSFYNGLVVKDGNTGFDFAVNWNGELQGPNGAFLRTKDDTKTKWSAWRELMFKDYADNHYLGKGNGLTVKENIVNAVMGVVTMPEGVETVTINTSAVTGNSRIFLTAQSGESMFIGSGPSKIEIGVFCMVLSRVPGTSFTIKVRHGVGAADVAWMIAEPY